MLAAIPTGKHARRVTVHNPLTLAKCRCQTAPFCPRHDAVSYAFHGRRHAK